jgi:flagellar hook-basal body complex protein FliE
VTVTPLSELAGSAAAGTTDSASAGSPLSPSPSMPPVSGVGSFADALSNAFDAASGALARADRSEHAYASGSGGLQAMVLDRAQADIALTIATTAASRTSQALSTILGMQV